MFRGLESTPVCRQCEPTHVEVRSLWRHGEAGSLGGILTTASKGGTVGKPVCLVVLERLPVAVHGTLREMRRGHRYQNSDTVIMIKMCSYFKGS